MVTYFEKQAKWGDMVHEASHITKKIQGNFILEVAQLF